jgi:hypothetical protein
VEVKLHEPLAGADEHVQRARQTPPPLSLSDAWEHARRLVEEKQMMSAACGHGCLTPREAVRLLKVALTEETE